MHSGDIKFVDITKADIRKYVNSIIGQADSLELSQFPCLCGKDHNMVWPTRRDDDDYNRLNRLTFLPVCPVRAWDESHTLKTSNSLYKFLGELRKSGRQTTDDL